MPGGDFHAVAGNCSNIGCVGGRARNSYAGNIFCPRALNDSAKSLLEQSALPTIKPPSSMYFLSFATFSSLNFSGWLPAI